MSLIDRRRVRGWVARYLPLEVLGTASALAGAWLAYELTGSLFASALVGAATETLGYYALVIVRAVRGHLASVRVRREAGGTARALLATALAIRSVVVEFGAAEVVDTFVVRPALLYAAAVAWGPQVPAWLAAKLAADLVFYAVAIVSFELGRHVILPDRDRPAAGSVRLDPAVRSAGPLEPALR